jgi:hypothetical protein
MYPLESKVCRGVSTAGACNAIIYTTGDLCARCAGVTRCAPCVTCGYLVSDSHMVRCRGCVSYGYGWTAAAIVRAIVRLTGRKLVLERSYGDSLSCVLVPRKYAHLAPRFPFRTAGGSPLRAHDGRYVCYSLQLNQTAYNMVAAENLVRERSNKETV